MQIVQDAIKTLNDGCNELPLRIRSNKWEWVNLIKLYYLNLPDVDNPTRLIQDAYYNLMQIDRYLYLAIKNANEEINELGWRTYEDEEILSDGVWVELINPPSGKDVDGRIYQDFLKSKRVYESKNNFRNGPYIEVLDKDFKNQRIKLQRTPRSDVLMLRPHLYDLKQQKIAIAKLQTIPLKEYRPLLRLLETSQDLKWPEITDIPFKGEWEFLSDEKIDGCLEQRNFVQKAINTNDFAILEGPPGSGKTTTICELIIQIAKRGERVMLCASTHVAIDNVIEKIKDHEEIVAVRIGDLENISETVKEIQIDRVLTTETNRLMSFLEKKFRRTKAQDHLYNALRSPERDEIIQNLILESSNVVCGTSTGILQHPEIQRDLYSAKPLYDYLIIDEASKTTFVEFLVPALLAKRWILTGDPRQLSPYVDRWKIEGIIRTFMNYDDRRVSQSVFLAKRGVNSLFQSEDVEFINKLKTQAEYFDEDTLELRTLEEIGPLKISLKLLSARIIVGNKEEIKKIDKYLTRDFGIVEIDEDLHDFLRGQSYWADSQTDDFSEKNWESEITWRLIRAHEMRKYPQEVEKLESEIKNLIPVYYSAENKSDLLNTIYRTGFISLPSIIETLREGFQFSRIRDIKYPTTLELGISQGILNPRHEVLTFQHRMHPDISSFPRKYVYDDEALKDPTTILKDRSFPYPHYGSQAEWINVSVREKMKQYNPEEIKCIMSELTRFIHWSKKNRKQNNQRWEVAIITFYRAQEDELRKALRDYTQQKQNKFEFTIGNEVSIRLGTVDSFQGREADVV
ncbi:MAG: AAA domain-containing protein, partial [Candidatus Hermodarchaeota archaeon]